MSADLRMLADWVEERAWPTVRCPSCPTGFLLIEKLAKVESEESKRDHDDDNWEPHWIRGMFFGTLKCNSLNCREPVVIVGQYNVREVMSSVGDWPGEEYGDYLKLRFSEPPMALGPFPAATPESVVAALVGTSALLWSDPGAAGNRLRVAVEALLTERKVKRYVINKQRRRVRLSTHQRLDVFKRRAPAAGEALEAVKWIGNAGSHEDSLTAKDVLDGVDVMRKVLLDLYDEEDRQLARKIRGINRSRGPLKNKKT